MSIVITVILVLIGVFIISLITTPYIDNAIRFAKLKTLSLEQLKKKFSTLSEKAPEDFFYKMNPNSSFYHLDYKLTMGGASHIYFEIINEKIQSILIVSKFNPEKWFERIKKTYITNRNEKHTIDHSLEYGKDIYRIQPKEYRSEALKRLFPTSFFDFGINHQKKFFMYFH